ncbi:MAG: SDR family oxidoreductase [Actinobacteria bacterium]|nr:SDR family oxidoreductase [Actinomycetota bacterium]
MGRGLAVVTGASSGIGAATARLLAGDGREVVLVARRRERLEELAGEIAAAGGTAHVEPLDASDGDAVLDMAERVLRQLGTPHAIVNSAGAGEWRWIEDTPPADMGQMMGAPFGAAYNTTHAFMRAMLDAGRGVIVHVGSPASLAPWPSAVAYTASRWALRGMHEALCQDLAGTGVHSCHVVFSEVSSEYFEANPGSHEHIPKVGSTLLRTLTPERCAEVIRDTIARPRREVVHPVEMRALAWTNQVATPLVRTLARVTGRRRPQSE